MSLRDRLLFEDGLREVKPFYNYLLGLICGKYPKLERAILEARAGGWDARCHFLIDPAGVETYWHELLGMTLREVKEERQRLYENLDHAYEQLEGAPYCFTQMFSFLKGRKAPAVIQDGFDDWFDFCLGYTEIWVRCLRLPLRNRLFALSEYERQLHDHGDPSESFLTLVTERVERRRRQQEGRTPDWGLRREARRAVVELLIDEGRTFKKLGTFYAEVADRVESWGSESAARKQFGAWLGDRRPSSIEGWRTIASWYEMEERYALELDWTPKPEDLGGGSWD